MSATFKQPAKNDGPVFDPVLKRKIRYWDGKLLDYRADMFESYRLQHEYNKQSYPDLTHIQLIALTRFVIPQAGMVEIDEQGTLDTSHKVKECLVWLTEEYVDDFRYMERGGQTKVQVLPHGGAFQYGTFQGVDPIYDYDRNGNITNAKQGGIVNIFYQPWSKSFAEKLIKELGTPTRPSVVAVANPRGSQLSSQTVGHKSVPCLAEFLEADSAQDLIDANNCMMLSKDKGGFKDFIQKKADAQKLGISVGQLIAEARQKQLAELEAITKGRTA